MLKAAAYVCALILVITYFSEQCYSLEIHYEHVGDNDLEDNEDLFTPETIKYVENHYEESVAEIPQQPQDGFLKSLFGGDMYRDENVATNKLEDLRNDASENARSRVVRQAHHAQAPLYPQLPSSPPYNQYQPYPNYNNQNPQWRPPNNYTQQGYNPNGGVTNSYPSTQQNSSYGHNSYNNHSPSQSQTPYYNNQPSSYPGYRPPNSTVYNPGSSRPPYNQHGNINSYPSYPTKTPYRPGNTSNPYNPSQRPPYSPTYPSNGRPVIHDNSTNRLPYNNQNTSTWAGNTGPNSRPFNGQNGQNAQYFNSYPNQHPYGQPNSSFPHSVPNQNPYNPSNGGQHPYNNNNNNAGPYGQNPQNFNSYPQARNPDPYNNPSNGQYGSNSYTGNPHGSDTFNLSNGYNPTIPNRPPYGAGGGAPGRYPPGSNGTVYDPTRVSPEYFSYPH